MRVFENKRRGGWGGEASGESESENVIQVKYFVSDKCCTVAHSLAARASAAGGGRMFYKMLILIIIEYFELFSQVRFFGFP